MRTLIADVNHSTLSIVGMGHPRYQRGTGSEVIATGVAYGVGDTGATPFVRV